MKPELMYLVYVTILTGLIWIPYVLDRMAVWGLRDTVGYPETPKPQSGWADRMMAAHVNAVENLIVFAPLVLTAHALGISNGITVGACAIYFWARLAHVVVYTLGIPGLRTLSFAIAWLAQAALVLAIFKLV